MTALPTVPAPRVPVTTTYHGVDVTEDYRWLEDSTSPETQQWTQAQQARTRVEETTDIHSFLFDQLDLGYPAPGSAR